jgi:hypothetical protein
VELLDCQLRVAGKKGVGHRIRHCSMEGIIPKKNQITMKGKKPDPLRIISRR